MSQVRSVSLPVELDQGDLTRILLAMDARIEAAKASTKQVRLAALVEYHDRLVVTRNKIQAAWMKTMPKRTKKRARKAGPSGRAAKGSL